ncbi:S9 family peptidase [Aureibaculum sp. 2210JD6-5]|uniref:S9 family peptidase n=1 Tax=Aureibaculum sp. 2210JD6-5 TaxID=3103957 RepID=UPI002AACACB6|nr:S9 family peptidase [Aureibaculum sp. 2210JD6-5]MDY7394819.1 S9 family peptidase [Aureibaculum sp. 2210JD6-5]
MRTQKLLFLVLVLLSLQVFSQQTKAPIIDREIFFGNPEISSGQLSPDGQWISFLKEYDGIMNIWVKKFDEPFDKAKPLTDNERPIGGYFWTYDSKNILFVKDNKGDENYNIYGVKPTAEADKETGVPVSKNLSPMKDVRVQIFQVSRKNPNEIMVGINDRDKAWHDLYKLDIATGKLELLYENTNRITGWDFDWDENPRLAFRTNEDGFSEIHRIDGDNKFTKIYETNLQEQAYVAGWNKDNTKMYLVSNKGDVNFSTLYTMDPQTKKIEKIESDPKNKVDFGGMFLDNNTREIIYTSYTYDKRERLWKNKKWEKMFKFLENKFKGKEIGFASFTKDYKQMLVSTSSDNAASETYYFNWDTKELIHQYTPRPRLKEVEQYLAKMEPVSYKSSDGLEIPGYLTVPYGAEKKNLPMVVLVHGGPKGPRDYWGYNPYAQILANRGYAVLQPNFRASGGYGKSFLNAGDRQWGKLMQDDITWGVKHFIAQGVADKDRVAIMGGSYGGYATLAGLAFTPDVYACGVDIVGPSNLFTLLESIPAYWESFRKSLYEMTGDPETEEGKKLIMEASPLFHADKITKPLLIIQGANDPRVKQAESDQIVVSMRDSGKDIEYILADDEGHGFRKPNNNMAMWVAIEKFLAKHLDGRYQKDMSDEVAKRLEEITQDVSKVVYKKANKVSVAEALPKLSDDLKEVTNQYDVNVEVQGQKIPMQSTREVKKEGTQWVIKDASTSAMGNTEDILYLENMSPVKRIINQGGQTFEINYAKDKVSLTMMGKTSELPLDGAFLTNGAGYDLLVARLPLAEGYETSFYNLDMMSQKLKTMKLKVDGKENNQWKVSIYNVENEKELTTMLIDIDKKMASQIEQVLPAMGNAKIKSTLK